MTNGKMEVAHGAAANTWETMIKIEIPHEAVRKCMVPQGGPVIWQTRHSKVKHEWQVNSVCFPMVNLRVQGTRTSMSGAEMDLTVLEDVRSAKVTEPTHPLTSIPPSRSDIPEK